MRMPYQEILLVLFIFFFIFTVSRYSFILATTYGTDKFNMTTFNVTPCPGAPSTSFNFTCPTIIRQPDINRCYCKYNYGSSVTYKTIAPGEIWKVNPPTSSRCAITEERFVAVPETPVASQITGWFASIFSTLWASIKSILGWE